MRHLTGIEILADRDGGGGAVAHGGVGFAADGLAWSEVAAFCSLILIDFALRPPAL